MKIQKIWIYSQNIGMEWAMLKVEKKNKEKNRTTKSRKNYYYYYSTLEFWKRTSSNEQGWKKKKRRVSQEQEKTFRYQDLQHKSHQRKKHFCSPSCKLPRTILKMDKRRTQKNGPMDKKIDDNAQDDTDILHVSRKVRGRGLISIEENVDSSIRGFKDYIQKNKERLITAASNKNDWVRKVIHRQLCKKLKFDHTTKWYMYNIVGFWDRQSEFNSQKRRRS